MSIQVVCAVCGKSEEVYPSQAKRYKTCSLECRGKYSAERYENRIIKNCAICNVEMNVKPSRFERTKTCSVECHAEYRKTLPKAYGCATSNWKGGKYSTPNGYIKIYDPDNLMADRRGYVLEHRLVMSEVLERPLTSDEEVHHKDRNPSNNDPGNLEVLSKAEHTRIHVKERIFTRDKNGRITGVERS